MDSYAYRKRNPKKTNKKTFFLNLRNLFFSIGNQKNPPQPFCPNQKLLFALSSFPQISEKKSPQKKEKKPPKTTLRLGFYSLTVRHPDQNQRPKSPLQRQLTSLENDFFAKIVSVLQR